MEIETGKTVSEREDEGTTVNVLDEVGNPTGDTILVAGTYSTRYRKAQNDLRSKSVKHRGPVTGDLVDERQLEVIAASIISWEGFTSGGKPIPYNRHNAVALLTACPWIREQVEAAMTDHAAFFPKPSAS